MIFLRKPRASHHLSEERSFPASQNGDESAEHDDQNDERALNYLPVIRVDVQEDEVGRNQWRPTR